MKSLFLDANIFFTATLSPNGGSSMLFELAKLGKVELSTSLYALNEAKRNILRKVGRASLPRLYTLVSELKKIDQIKHSDEEIEKWTEWIILKDAPILNSAQFLKVEALITLDKKDFKSSRMKNAPIRFKILSPGELIQSL
ncbi:MAG: hypothetical protein AAB383_04805 [Patescibacteria group bacterium]